MVALPQGSERPGGYARYVLGLLLVVSIIAYSDRLVIGFLIDPIKHDLGITDTQAGLLTGLAFSVFYAVMGLPLGRAVDTRPRNIVLAACIAIWSICTMLCGLAGSALILFMARCGIGAGEAAMNPSAVSLIGDRYPRPRVVAALAFYSIGVVGGGGLAILLGGQLVAYLSSLGPISFLGFDNIPVWRFVFIALGLPGLLAALIVLLTVKDPERASGLNAAGAKIETEATRDASAWIWANRRIYGYLIAGLVAFGFYNYSVLSWYPAMLGRTFGATPGEISIWYGCAYLVSGISGALLSAPLVNYFRRRASLDAPATVLMFSSLLALLPAVAGPLMPSFELTIACFLLSMFSSAIQTSVAFSAFLLVTPSHRRGLVIAIYIMVMNLTGGAFGGVVIGLLSDHVFGTAYVAWSIAAMAAVAIPISALCFGLLRPSYRAAASREELRLEAAFVVENRRLAEEARA